LTKITKALCQRAQPPNQWVPEISGRGVNLTNHFLLVPRLIMCGVILPLPHTSSWLRTSVTHRKTLLWPYPTGWDSNPTISEHVSRNLVHPRLFTGVVSTIKFHLALNEVRGCSYTVKWIGRSRRRLWSASVKWKGAHWKGSWRAQNSQSGQPVQLSWLKTEQSIFSCSTNSSSEPIQSSLQIHIYTPNIHFNAVMSSMLWFPSRSRKGTLYFCWESNPVLIPVFQSRIFSRDSPEAIRTNCKHNPCEVNQ
jgi:hypothetical protein